MATHLAHSMGTQYSPMKWLINQSSSDHLNDVGLFSYIFESNGTPMAPDTAGLLHKHVYLDSYGNWVIS